MNKLDALAAVKQLESNAEHVRDKLNVSRRGEVLFQAPQSMWSENDIVVEANGSGGATLMVVVGNYPADYSIK